MVNTHRKRHSEHQHGRTVHQPTNQWGYHPLTNGMFGVETFSSRTNKSIFSVGSRNKPTRVELAGGFLLLQTIGGILGSWLHWLSYPYKTCKNRYHNVYTMQICKSINTDVSMHLQSSTINMWVFVPEELTMNRRLQNPSNMPFPIANV